MSQAKLTISADIRGRWEINNQSILESKSKADGCFVFKFCYDPETGEFICDSPPYYHKEMIDAYGQKQFNDYVRGIYFREKKIVYLRQHEEEKLLFQTRDFLREHGAPVDMRIIWGEAAAKELACELKGL